MLADSCSWKFIPKSVTWMYLIIKVKEQFTSLLNTLPLATASGALHPLVWFLVLGPIGQPWSVAEWNCIWLAMWMLANGLLSPSEFGSWSPAWCGTVVIPVLFPGWAPGRHPEHVGVIALGTHLLASTTSTCGGWLCLFGGLGPIHMLDIQTNASV